ncbi:MAG: hypothetical protein ABIQ04_03935 [Candidatus Saccharimonadales bacterium]
MHFLQNQGHNVTVDSGSVAHGVSGTASVGAIGNFDQVVRISVTTLKSSREYYYDLVVGSRFGSDRGYGDAEARERIALQLTLTASDVADSLQTLGHQYVTLLFKGIPMSPDIKREMANQSKRQKLKSMSYELLRA